MVGLLKACFALVIIAVTLAVLFLLFVAVRMIIDAIWSVENSINLTIPNGFCAKGKRRADNGESEQDR